MPGTRRGSSSGLLHLSSGKHGAGCASFAVLSFGGADVPVGQPQRKANAVLPQAKRSLLPDSNKPLQEFCEAARPDMHAAFDYYSKFGA